jgi:hypothetical protein
VSCPPAGSDDKLKAGQRHAILRFLRVTQDRSWRERQKPGWHALLLCELASSQACCEEMIVVLEQNHPLAQAGSSFAVSLPIFVTPHEPQ